MNCFRHNSALASEHVKQSRPMGASPPARPPDRLAGRRAWLPLVGVAVVVVVPVVLTVLAWDELLPHVVERWSGSSALARVWVSAGGGLLLLYVYWVGEKILERQLIGAALLALTLPFMAVGGGLLTVFFNLLWGPIGTVVAPLFGVSFLAAAGWCFIALEERWHRKRWTARISERHQ